jgi:hypothetical protein
MNQLAPTASYAPALVAAPHECVLRGGFVGRAAIGLLRLGKTDCLTGIHFNGYPWR